MMEQDTVKAILFDLDGTLLNTLEDLSGSVNYALRRFCLPERSQWEIRRFLGNGIRHLMQCAVPPETENALFEEVFMCFRTHYVKHCLDRTRPYDGIMPLLETLKSRGYRMAIVSNKLQPAVTELNERFFKKYVTSAIGESATVRRKPNPDAVLAALKELDATPEEAIYVGDSEVDIETARRAGTRCVSVTWGFRDEAELITSGATTVIYHPEELLNSMYP